MAYTLIKVAFVPGISLLENLRGQVSKMNIGDTLLGKHVSAYLPRAF